jgi:hypothetical protein
MLQVSQLMSILPLPELIREQAATEAEPKLVTEITTYQIDGQFFILPWPNRRLKTSLSDDIHCT